MPARNTIFVPHGYYHIYNRGSEKRAIFLSDRDYQNFRFRLEKTAEKYDTDVLVYCLVPNHFHLLLHQKPMGSIQQFLHALQLGHAKFFNTKYERVGPLFQNRFKAKSVETDEYLLQLSAYIHRNAPASKNAKNIHDLLLSYPYSSYRAYVLKEPSFVQTKTILNYFSQTLPKLTYQAFVERFTPDIEALSPWIIDAE
jgi:REP element-mobilizing transposase RayT